MLKFIFNFINDNVAKGRVKGYPFPVAWPNNEPHTEMTYHEYLASPEWDIRSGMFIDRANGECQQCGSYYNLHIHHRHYDTLGEESYGDIEVLCRDCHKTRHKGWK